MLYEIFIAEWFRVTSLVRKRAIHNQITELSLVSKRLSLSPAERASLMGTEILQARLWKIRGGME